MKKLLFIVLVLLSSCKGCDGTIIERQKSLKEVCPNCVLTYASYDNRVGNGTNTGNWIAQDTSKSPNVIYQVIFCHGIFQPIWKVNYITKIN